MYHDARNFIDAVGGYRSVAMRFRLSSTTVHTHMSTGKLPPKWYGAMLEFANEKGVEPPPRNLFSFMSLPQLKKDEVQK